MEAAIVQQDLFPLPGSPPSPIRDAPQEEEEDWSTTTTEDEGFSSSSSQHHASTLTPPEPSYALWKHLQKYEQQQQRLDLEVMEDHSFNFYSTGGSEIECDDDDDHQEEVVDDSRGILADQSAATENLVASEIVQISALEESYNQHDEVVEQSIASSEQEMDNIPQEFATVSFVYLECHKAWQWSKSWPVVGRLVQGSEGLANATVSCLTHKSLEEWDHGLVRPCVVEPLDHLVSPPVDFVRHWMQTMVLPFSKRK